MLTEVSSKVLQQFFSHYLRDCTQWWLNRAPGQVLTIQVGKTVHERINLVHNLYHVCFSSRERVWSTDQRGGNSVRVQWVNRVNRFPQSPVLGQVAGCYKSHLDWLLWCNSCYRSHFAESKVFVDVVESLHPWDTIGLVIPSKLAEPAVRKRSEKKSR